MNTSSNATVMSNREFYRQREYAALHRIPGAYEMIYSNADQRAMLEKKYPDAAFSLYIVSNLLFFLFENYVLLSQLVLTLISF